jgi:hypothetical protein
VAAQMGEPDRAIAALQKLLSIPYEGALAACRSLLRCSGSIRCSIRSGMIRASKNWLSHPREVGASESWERIGVGCFICAFYPWEALFVLNHGKGIVRLLKG